MTPTDPMVAARLVVRGLVQGVWFRVSCRVEARRLGVSGWVANRPDGSVAVHVEGEAVLVDALVAWCRVGPPGASVDDVLVEPVEPERHRVFEIR